MKKWEVTTEKSLEACGQLARHKQQWTRASASNKLEGEGKHLRLSSDLHTCAPTHPNISTHIYSTYHISIYTHITYHISTHTIYHIDRHTLKRERECILAKVCYRAKYESASKFSFHTNILFPKNTSILTRLKLETGSPISWASIFAFQRVEEQNNHRPHFLFLHTWCKSISPRSSTFPLGDSVCCRLTRLLSIGIFPSWAQLG